MKDLSRREKSRVIVFAAISLLSSALAVWLAWGICDMFSAPLIDVGDGELYVDGTDFSSCVALATGAINGMLLMIYFGAAVIYVLLAAAGAALASVLLRVIALKRAENIGAAELSLTRGIFLAASITQAAASVIIAVVYVITRGSPFGLVGLLMCWQYPLFAGLIYIKRLKGLAEGAG